MEFKAEVVARHLNYDVGEIVYMTEVEWRFSTPTLYAVVNPKTGKKVDYVDANEFKGRFKEIINDIGRKPPS